MNDFSNLPSPTQPRRPVKVSWADGFLVRLNGNEPEAVAERGTPEDLATVRNQGVWKLVSFGLDASLITVGVASVGDGIITPSGIGIGLSAATCLLAVDRTLASRYIYQKGKRELKRAGVSRLGFGGDDIAYGVMLGTRLVIGVSKAILLGTVAAQFAFAAEIHTYQRKGVAAVNAPIMAKVEREFAATGKTLAAQAKQDADLEREVNRDTQALRRLDGANTQQVGRRGASDERRQFTQQQLAAYEGRSTAAHEKTIRSEDAYQTFLRQQNRLKRERTESDSNYTPPARGFLENTTALLAATQGNTLARVGMALFDALLVAVELWSVIILFGARPTIFSVNSARDYFVARSEIARKMVATIKDGPVPPGHPIAPEPTNEANGLSGPQETPPSLTAFVIPPKRGRGRPRKSAVPYQEEEQTK